VGFVVDKVVLGQVFSEYFVFPCQFSFHRLLHIHHHHLSSGAGTIGQLAADVPSGLSLTTSQETKKVTKTDAMERMLKERIVTKFDSLSLYLTGGAEKNLSQGSRYVGGI
jgi:hypothetical protein